MKTNLLEAAYTEGYRLGLRMDNTTVVEYANADEQAAFLDGYEKGYAYMEAECRREQEWEARVS